MAGPRLGLPCFACCPCRVAFGMVCGSLDHSPVESSIDLCCLMQVPASCLFRDLLKLNVCS
uniref:Uncharacterized protein n=1 Tax=Brassica oleracea TaxID=3712 RepID=A0A3P6F864_BRAOL|nr:unnamed protein product [Brassica oleracea]